MRNRKYGYIRVSTKTQKEDRQIAELSKYVNPENMIVDKVSGKDFNREGYQTLKKFIRTGDELYIKSLDRLGRNKSLIKEELEYFKTNGIIVRILDVPTTLMDFGKFEGMQSVIMDMVNNILIEVLGTIAETERTNIRTRQAEGIKQAKAKGIHCGRPKTEYPKNWSVAMELLEKKLINGVEAMNMLELKKTTYYKLLKQYRG